MSNSPKVYIIDFDSTFTQVEALDELAKIVLKNNAAKEQIEQQISEITNQAMNGQISFDQALSERIQLLTIHKNDIDSLIKVLKQKVSVSFIKNKDKIQLHQDSIYIVSGGFKEFIWPVVQEFGIQYSHVFANEFILNEQGFVTGYHQDNLLAQPQGKVQWAKKMNFQTKVVVIGDGYTDYEIREAGLASTFYLFAENIERKQLVDKADHIIYSIDDIIA